MDIFEKLPNKSEIEAWINAYSGRDNDTNSVSLRSLLRFWNDEKVDLYKMFGENYILEKKVNFEKSIYDRKKAVRDNLFGLPFYDRYYRWARSVQRYLNWQNNKEDNITFDGLDALMTETSLANNKYDGPSFKITIADEVIQVPRGSKPSRILAKIANYADIEGYENFRLKHSFVLNDRFVKGTLCLSIHPLDYMTMSDNDYDWQSCMNWRDEGCYRMGTVEMMNSPYVVVAYLKGDDNLRFYQGEWNNKRWRNLFIVDRDVIIGIKGYPYQNTQLDTFCLEWLKELAEKNLGYSYLNKIFENRFDSAEETFEFEDEETEIKVNFSFETGLMYNDFGNDNNSHFIIGKSTGEDGWVSIHYSGVAECMKCGTIIEDGYNCAGTELLICTDCNDVNYCNDCGATLSQDDTYELDGDYLCEDCYYAHRVWDPVDEDWHLKDNCTRIYLLDAGEEKEAASDIDILNTKKSIWVFNPYTFNYKGIPVHTEYVDNNIWLSAFKYLVREECPENIIEFFDKAEEIE